MEIKESYFSLFNITDFRLIHFTAMVDSTLKQLIEISNQLTTNDISKLKLLLKVPVALFETEDGENFLFGLKQWSGHNAFNFYQSLQSVRPDLVMIANKIPWLCSSIENENEEVEEGLTINSFINFMKAELTIGKQKMILIAHFKKAEEPINIEITLAMLLDKGLIRRNLKKLSIIMADIGRNDLINKFKDYQKAFCHMEEDEFLFKFRNALKSAEKQVEEWKNYLKQYTKLQNIKVKQMLGKDDSVYLADVFVELTIVGQAPRAVNYEDETTYNEITFLRKIADNELKIRPVDLQKELRYSRVDYPEIWCLIGNPGCGKTFLSKRIALTFCEEELKQISFTISIPCRNAEWHALEVSCQEAEGKLTSENIQEWLCIGLPLGPSWSKNLAKYLVEVDGQGLMLVIDGLDEFTKALSFKKTILHNMLTRRTLTKSRIILTTRPGAWTDISSKHELRISRCFHVLGFSPKNRDLYFEKQIMSEYRLNECKRLLERYDEMRQLALIPVNASLFAALLKDESVSIHTLTQLYDELTCYLIRRQLCRMGLEELAEVTNIQLFHPCVKDCLHSIGLIALGGVYRRELTSTDKLSLTIDHVETESHCLGLAHEFHKKEAVDVVTKVWGFAHLTMQEFTSAVFLRSTSWTDQCMSIRFVADSDEHFSIFRMVVRFLCGLITERSAAILTVLYRKLITQTVQDLPMYHQLEYEQADHLGFQLKKYTGWYEFTKKYFQLTPIIFETNSKSITNCFNQFLQNSICIYLNNKVLPVSPNEWECFLQSLQLVNHIQVIHIDTNSFNLTQFKSLLEIIANSPLSYLALRFYNKDSTKILIYTDLLKETKLRTETGIFIELNSCTLTDVKTLSSGLNILSTDVNMFSTDVNILSTDVNILSTDVNMFSTDVNILSTDVNMLSTDVNILSTDVNILSTDVNILSTDVNRNIAGMKLYNGKCSNQFIQSIANQLSAFQYLYLNKYYSEYETIYNTILPALSNATQLRGIYLYEIPSEYHQQVIHTLSLLSELQEIRFHTYSLLPHIMHLSRISYLEIRDIRRYTDLSECLIQLIHRNQHTIRGLKLDRLKSIGIKSWNGFLNVLHFCVNLVQLELRWITQLDDVTLWSSTLCNLNSLVILIFIGVELFDAGLISLCEGLIAHPTIKELCLYKCKQTSESCGALTNLIHTVSYLEKLIVDNLSKPDTEPIKLLKQTAEEYSIETFFHSIDAYFN